MKVHFYSSLQEGLFQQALRRELGKLGVESEAVHAVTLDEYRSASGSVGRALIRAKMYPGYMWKCAHKWMRGRSGQVNVITTNPFFLPYFATKFLGPRRAKTVQLLWDLFPDALIEAGVVNKDSPSVRWLSTMTKQSLERCDATVFLGEHLKSYAESVYGRALKGFVIPVGADGDPFVDSPPQLDESCSWLRLLYCGNMGRMHDSITMSEALGNLASSRVRLSAKFFGTGQGFRQVRQAVTGGEGNLSIEFGPGLDDKQWVCAMKDASVALVTMRSGAERVVMPSKTYSALTAGQAILAICSRESDLADLIHKYDCGWIVEPGNTEKLTELLEYLSLSPREVHRKRLNAYSAGHKYFGANVLAGQWLDLFRTIEQ